MIHTHNHLFIYHMIGVCCVYFWHYNIIMIYVWVHNKFYECTWNGGGAAEHCAKVKRVVQFAFEINGYFKHKRDKVQLDLNQYGWGLYFGW